MVSPSGSSRLVTVHDKESGIIIYACLSRHPSSSGPGLLLTHNWLLYLEAMLPPYCFERPQDGSGDR